MIKANEYQGLSDSELLERGKAAKSALIWSCGIMGVFIGIAIYSAVRNGIDFFTFFPLFFVFLISKNQSTNKALLEEIKLRKLR